MKKLLILIILLFIPFMVYAESCETNKVTISNISLVENSNGVIEVSDASINNNQVFLNLKFKNLNDSAKYRETIKNDSKEDYEIDNIVNASSEYITYELKTEDNVNIVKAGTSRDAILLVTYSKQVPLSAYSGDKYNESRTVTIDLSAGDNVVNPKTGNYSYAFILIMFIIGFTLIYLIINKSKYSKYFVLFLLILIPIGLKAICKVEVKVVSNIEIEKQDIAFLMAGSNTDSGSPYLRTNIAKADIEKITFVNSIEGHTINGTDCFDVSLNEDGKVLGWFTDSDSNSKYEMTIGANGKVYASNGNYLFFALYRLENIDGMEYFDTSYVGGQESAMISMFEGTSNLKSVDLSHFDTSKVTDMSSMFKDCKSLTTLDVSNFVTTNVTDMSNMFNGYK